MRVLPSDAYTLVICGACGTSSSLGRLSNSSAPALAASPVSAAAGNAAAATTRPANNPQMINEAAFASMLLLRLRIQFTGSGYGTGAVVALQSIAPWRSLALSADGNSDVRTSE